MNAKILCAIAIMVVAVATAMPPKSELKTAQALVTELMETKMAEFKAKKISAEQIADASMEYVKEAETEAVKFLLIKGAIGFYLRGEKYDKAADAFTELKQAVKDIPPSVQEDILAKAANRVSAKKAPKLFAMYKSVKMQVEASTLSKQLSLQLVQSPNDSKLRRKYAEALAACGNWDSALKEFSKLEEPYSGYAKLEAEGKAKDAAQAEFWWAYEPINENYGDVFKMHSAQFFRNALVAGEIGGIKKNIVAKRLASLGEDAGLEFAADSKSESYVVEEDKVAVKEEKAESGKEVSEDGVVTQTVVASALDGGTEWKYTTKLAKPNWQKFNYDDKDWLTGKGPFYDGTTTPRNVVDLGGTKWDSHEIILRKKFEYKGKSRQHITKVAIISILNGSGKGRNECAEASVEVWINETKIDVTLHDSSEYVEYDITQQALKAIKLGKSNLIAIKVHDAITRGFSYWTRYVDVGLSISERTGQRGR